MITSQSPYNQQIHKEFAPLSKQQIEAKLEFSISTYRNFRDIPIARKSEWMQEAAHILEKNKDQYARIITAEMGKLLVESLAEIEKCAWVCRYYAEQAPGFLKDQEIATDAAKSYVTYQPIGPILAVMPWNFPFWQVFRFLHLHSW